MPPTLYVRSKLDVPVDKDETLRLYLGHLLFLGGVNAECIFSVSCKSEFEDE